MKKKYDVTKVSRETLEKMATQVINAHNCGNTYCITFEISPRATGTAKDILQEAEVPLRTKAEVQQDVMKCLRSYIEFNPCGYQPPRWFFNSCYISPLTGNASNVTQDLSDLLVEETSD